MALKVALACVAVGLFCGTLLLFILGGTARVTIVEQLDAPSDRYPGGRYGTTSVQLSCAPLAGMLAGDASNDRDAPLGGGPQPDLTEPLLAGNDIARGQACANVRQAQSASIALLAVPAVIAGVAACTLPARRRNGAAARPLDAGGTDAGARQDEGANSREP
ncbi:hypothetical protein [Leucobacter sp. wl10]|uniref:hypothetical protein n=1 Tax=Leucobacter sp. wl10 TaxID=2304677 RepID=UPI000E5A6BBB|nr:hypothetical protein [Leucobacter sp. wl10]RGE19218.1 hypothetical protein D1J51_12505 [Leucobacter sp. wl10]